MRSLNSPKKRSARESVDGIIPQQRRQIGTPTYYRGTQRPMDGFIPAQASRRSPVHVAKEKPKKVEETPSKLRSFEQPKLEEQFIPRTATTTPRRGEKKQKRSPGKIRQWWKRRSLKFKAGFVSAIVLLVVGGALGARLYSFLNSVFAKDVGNSESAALNDKVTPDKVNTEGDGRLNVLILGRGGEENDAPNLTDTIIIASIDLETQEASLLSIPRDLWVSSNGRSSSKINTAFNTGFEQARYKGQSVEDSEKEGVKSAIAASRNVAGVPVHKYVLLDFKAFRDVVNALGGVDINVPTAINDRFTNYYFKAGQQTMNGDRALQYARSRHGSARGDFDRSERQRQLLVAMRAKATSTGIVANPVKLNSLANAIQKNIRTDLSVDESRTLFTRSKDLPDNKITSLDLAKPDAPLVTTGNISGQSIVRPVAGLADFTKIRAYVRTSMMDPFLKREKPTVAVYNGSGKTGAATLVGDVLVGYGYNVIAKETSQSKQTKTVVVKKTTEDKAFTYRYLSQRFGTVPITDLPMGAGPEQKTDSTTPSTTTTTQPDFIIVLGSDYVQKNDPTW